MKQRRDIFIILTIAEDPNDPRRDESIERDLAESCFDIFDEDYLDINIDGSEWRDPV